MDDFDTFEGRVCELIAAEINDPRRSIEMTLRAKGGGAFNDYYDEPSEWTEENARKLASFIVEQTARDEAFLREAAARFLLGRL